MADDRVDVVFGAEFSQLVTAVQQVRDLLGGLATSVKSAGEDFNLAGQNIQDTGGSLDAWSGTLNFIGTSLDTVLKGVLLGTQTWQQAMAKIFADLAVSFAEQIAGMLLSWAAFQASVGALGGSGGISGAGGGFLGLLGGLFGGGAAADGGAGAAMDVGDLAMFQAGTWSVPRDMIALVHAGEMILPADVAAAARGGAGAAPFPGGAGVGAGAGAGFTLNVSVQAMDARGVAQWANANAKTLATTITRYMGNNPSTRGD